MAPRPASRACKPGIGLRRWTAPASDWRERTCIRSWMAGSPLLTLKTSPAAASQLETRLPKWRTVRRLGSMLPSMSPKSLCFVPAPPLPSKWRVSRRRPFAATSPSSAPRANPKAMCGFSTPASMSRIPTAACVQECRDGGKFLLGGVPLATCFSGARLCGSIPSCGHGLDGDGRMWSDGRLARPEATRPGGDVRLSTSKARSQERAMMNSKTVAKILLTLALTLALLQFGCSDSRPAKVKAAPRPVANVPAAPPLPSDHASDREPFFVASGPLIVEHQVDVATQRDGVVAEV